jgi:hypothetical protein
MPLAPSPRKQTSASERLYTPAPESTTSNFIKYRHFPINFQLKGKEILRFQKGHHYYKSNENKFK